MQSVSGKYDESKAKAILTYDKFMPLTCLVVACDTLTDGGCFTWEIDTTLDELQDEECLPGKEARDRLLGGIACLTNPAFLWDAGAFMAMCQTINGNLAVPEIWEPLSPAQLAYGLNELNYLNKVYNNVNSIEPLYGEDPKIYMAGCLHDSGFPECPESLAICSEQLERFYDKQKDLDAQIANPIFKRKLDEVAVYLDTMTKLRSKKISSLRK